MLSRRIATFLVGVWVGCGLLMGVLMLQNARWAKELIADPTDPAQIQIIKVGEENARLLLEYGTAEQTRAFMSGWEVAQMLLGLIMLVILGLSAHRRVVPLALVGGMLVVVLVQHFAFTPEITFRGRQADFLADEAAFSTRSHLASLMRLYVGSEALKLLMGGVLASYLFAANSGKRVRRSKRTSVDTEAIGEA